MRSHGLLVALIALSTVAGSGQAQTINFGYDAGSSQFSGSSADYGVTVSSAAASALLPLTSGVTVSGVDLGELSFSSTGYGPNGVVETVPFSFTRPLSLSVDGAPGVPESESLSGTWGAQTGGSFGQYLLTDFTLDGASASYELGNSGTLQADFLPGQAYYDGLSGSQTIPILANFTYLAPAAIPEAPPLQLLGLGVLALFGMAPHFRKRLRRQDG